MAEEITLKVNVETGKAVANLGNLEKATKQVSRSSQQAAKGATTLEGRFDQLNKEIKESPVNIRQMNKQIQEYQAIALQAGRTSPLGKKAIQEAAQMKDKYNDINAEVNRLANDGVKMQAALNLGTTVIAGYAAFQGAMALAGVDSEKFRETLMKLQGAQALLMGIETIRKNLEKESTLVLMAKNVQEKISVFTTGLMTAAQTVYTTAIGASTGALKLFRIALIATGIGAIVVAVGLLIANFDKVKKAVMSVVSGTGKLGKTIQTILKIAFLPWYLSILAIIKALKWLGIIDVEKSIAEYKAYRARVEQLEQEQEELKKIIALRKEIIKQNLKESEDTNKITQNIIEAGNKKIALANAEGKSKREILKLQKEESDNAIKGAEKALKQHRKTKLDLVSIAAQLKRTQKHWDLMGKKAKETFIEQSKAYQEQVNQLQALKLEALKVIEEEKHAQKIAHAEARARRKETRKEQAKLEKKAIYDLALAQKQADAEEITNARIKTNELIKIEWFKLHESLKDTKLTNTQKELLIFKNEQAIDKIKEKFAKIDSDRQIALNKQLVKELNQLLKSVEDLENAHINRMTENLEKNRQIEENAIRDKYFTQIELLKERNESTKLLEEARGAEIAEINKKYNQLELQNRLELASQGANALQSLGDAVFSHKMKNLKKGSKEEEAMARKQFKFNKALQLSMAFIDGAKAITASLAQSPLAIGPIPNPAGIASLAFAAITSAAQIATIAAQQFSGGGSGGALNVSAASIGGGVPQVAPVTNTSTLVPQDAQQVYVTETDITNTQNKVSVIEAQSTF